MLGDDERTVLGLRVRIDRALCVGFGDCITAAPSAFRLDDAGIVVFADPDSVARATLVRACESCPVDALTAWDEEGNQLAP
jgi:ferredoxin